MSLPPGLRLGPYEIVTALGAGGMGEVYRARDTRLAREVAIKVLPAEVSSDASRLRRFEKEARAVSALNHPNIVTIHDIGSSDSVSWIAMELVEGKTLRELLFAGPVAVKKLLAIATQIAEGLARAHEVGIAHRDLKPENVMVTKDGLVKVLDFGLAKLTQTSIGSDEGSQLPTETGTSPGMIVGTVGYMSPEQAGGRIVDFRSDQFSFGSILYEMATGKRAFHKTTGVDTLAAILHEEPEPVEKTAPNVPAPVRWILERCLAKEPGERYDSTQDLARDLAACRVHLLDVMSGATPSGAASATVSRPRAIRRRVLVGAAAFVALALSFLWGRRTAPEGILPERVSFQRLTSRRGNVLHACSAPDGRTIVYSAAWDGKPAELFSVRTDSGESRPLGIPHADILSVSSKGELAILIKKNLLLTPLGTGTLARVALGGSAPREIAEDVLSASWSPDGSELAFTRTKSAGKSRLEYPVGKTLYETTGELECVRVSPKGDLVAFVEAENDRGFVVVADRGGKARRLSGPWESLGTLVWRPDGRSVVFDASSPAGLAIHEVSVTGKERMLFPFSGQMLILQDLLADGRLLVERAIGGSGMAMRSPGEEREHEVSIGARDPLLSADGSALVFTRGDGVFLQKTGAASTIRLGDGRGESLSPDGKWVLTLAPGPPNALVLLATGAGAARTLALAGLTTISSGKILPDGHTLLVAASETGKPIGLWTLPLEGGKPRLVLPETAPEGMAISPDGKKLALHMSGGKGFILPLDGGPRTLIAGLEPGDRLDQWSGDGRSLYVSRPQEVPGKIFRIEIETGRRELWKELMPADPAGVIAVSNSPVAISRDGRSYAYSYARTVVSDLFLLGGVK